VDGWECDQEQKTCREICNDGLVVGIEKCDAGPKEGCL